MNDELTNVKDITFSDDKYEGHNNEEIISLYNDIGKAKAEIQRIESKIEKIRNNCKYIYLFNCTSIYEDLYTCKLCGNSIWK